MLTMKEHGAPIQDIRTLLTLGTVGALTDGELLGLFIARRGEAAEMAFSALVERHGPMVFRVCRSILRDEHDSQDAFQACFLILVNQAGTVRDRSSVGSWLHGVALRVAACARASVIRRHGHERRAAGFVAPDYVPAEIEPDLAPALHGELDRLPERYRVPIVLCYLEGLACEEAAQRLRLPVGTVKSRLARGRDRLRSRLIRRGLAPSALLLKSVFSGEAARAAIPSRVVLSTVRMATHFATGGPVSGVVPMAVRLLTEGALKAMNWSRLKGIAQAVMAAAVVMACAGGVARVATKSRGAAPQAEAPKPPVAAAPGERAEAREAEAESPERLLLRSRDVIEKLPPSFEKASLFSELATTQAELTYYTAARETGRRAAETVLAIDKEPRPSLFVQQKTNELREAAKALASAGDVEAALAAEEKIGVASPIARSYREFVLQEVGYALAKGGFVDEAKRVMNVMRQKGLKTEIVAWSLASAQAKAGNVKAAVQTADSIADDLFHVAALVGLSFEGPTDYVELNGGIALAQFHSGDRAGALETLRKAQAIAESAADMKSKGRSLGLIARALVTMGDLPSAIRITASIMDDTGRDRAEVEIAMAHAAAGRWIEAMKVVESIRGDAPRLVALTRLGWARGKAKDPEAARKLFSRALEIAKDLKVNGEPDRSGAYYIAYSQAESGDYRGARETLRRSRPDAPAEEAAEIIAMIRAKAGDFSGALLTLGSLPSSLLGSARSQVLSEIVRLQIESGDDQHVLESVDGFDSPVCQARVLMGIARGLSVSKHARAKGESKRSPEDASR
jgi:RNA polymerase sigma factor (sigma-70 family)